MHGIGVLASLGGSILVRSYERSEWIYKAMILRGYGSEHAESSQNEFKICSRDIVILSVVLLIAAGFIAGDILYRHG